VCNLLLFPASHISQRCDRGHRVGSPLLRRIFVCGSRQVETLCLWRRQRCTLRRAISSKNPPSSQRNCVLFDVTHLDSPTSSNASYNVVELSKRNPAMIATQIVSPIYALCIDQRTRLSIIMRIHTSDKPALAALAQIKAIYFS
jgi:hypothetical protein